MCQIYWSTSLMTFQQNKSQSMKQTNVPLGKFKQAHTSRPIFTISYVSTPSASKRNCMDSETFKKLSEFSKMGKVRQQSSPTAESSSKAWKEQIKQTLEVSQNNDQQPGQMSLEKRYLKAKKVEVYKKNRQKQKELQKKLFQRTQKTLDTDEFPYEIGDFAEYNNCCVKMDHLENRQRPSFFQEQVKKIRAKNINSSQKSKQKKKEYLTQRHFSVHHSPRVKHPLVALNSLNDPLSPHLKSALNSSEKSEVQKYLERIQPSKRKAKNVTFLQTRQYIAVPKEQIIPLKTQELYQFNKNRREKVELFRRSENAVLRIHELGDSRQKLESKQRLRKFILSEDTDSASSIPNSLNCRFMHTNHTEKRLKIKKSICMKEMLETEHNEQYRPWSPPKAPGNFLPHEETIQCFRKEGSSKQSVYSRVSIK